MKTADRGEVNYCILQATYMYATKLEEKKNLDFMKLDRELLLSLIIFPNYFS